MTPIDELLETAVEDFAPDAGEGLRQTQRRVHRRRRRGRVGAAVAGLVLMGAMSVFVWRTFVHTDRAQRSRGPAAAGECWNRRSQRVCIHRTSDVRTLAQGRHDGTSWTVRAFTATYVGLWPPVGEAEALEARRPLMCSILVFQRRNLVCEGIYEETHWAPAVPDSDLRIERRFPLRDTSRGDPLAGVGAAPQQVNLWPGIVHAWVPARTQRADVITPEGTVAARLIDPSPELHGYAKLLLAFGDHDAETIRMIGFAERGEILWRFPEERVQR